ncbi:hypothetical protein BA011_07610 [Rhizobium leguminosarum]|jgi:hypothetical protein|uniref:Uncharacterized protein n=1 Tax=Rhizobium leguminosarum TaxID=384 RepID=A0A1B1C757_RHILE|nr:hypothetical protein BA011_07610 [Rhizobium leguminosarum]
MASATTFFTSDSLASVATASLIIIVVTNTVRRVLGVQSVWVPAAVSLIVAFAGAVNAGILHGIWDGVLAVFNGCLLFCTATGAQETVVSNPIAKDTDRPSLQSAKRVRWFSSWLRKNEGRSRYKA